VEARAEFLTAAVGEDGATQLAQVRILQENLPISTTSRSCTL